MYAPPALRPFRLRVAAAIAAAACAFALSAAPPALATDSATIEGIEREVYSQFTPSDDVVDISTYAPIYVHVVPTFCHTGESLVETIYSSCTVYNYALDGDSALTRDTDYTLTILKDGVAVDDVVDFGTYTARFTGIGAYTGTVERTFKVVDQYDLAEIYFYMSVPYRGINIDSESGAKVPSYTFLTAGDEVVDSSFYTVEYSLNGTVVEPPFTQVGEYTYTITGKSPYYNGRTGTFNVIDSNSVALAHPNSDWHFRWAYTGSPVKPVPILQLESDETLTPGTDYSLEYYDGRAYLAYADSGGQAAKPAPISNPTEMGFYYVVATGIGEHCGALGLQYEIIDASDFTKAEIVTSQYGYPYTGSPIDPGVTVNLAGETLVENTDYELSIVKYDRFLGENVAVDPIAPGNYQVIATGKGEYSGTATYGGSFIIEGDGSLNNCYVSYESAYTLFEGRPIDFGFNVYTYDGDLVDPANYDLVFYDAEKNRLEGEPTGPGEYYVVANGKGAYGGMCYSYDTFRVVSANDLAAGEVSGIQDYSYNGSALEPTVWLSMPDEDGELTIDLTENVDYTVSYEYADGTAVEGVPTEVGKYYMVFNAITSQGWTGTARFGINILASNDVGAANLDYSYAYRYTGDPIKLKLKVTLNNTRLVEGDDYTVAYGTSEEGEFTAGPPTEMGDYDVRITGTGEYTGTKTFWIIVTDDESYGFGDDDEVDFEVTLDEADDTYEYTGSAINPQVVSVFYDGAKLAAGEDYTARFGRSFGEFSLEWPVCEAGSYYVEIVGAGEYVDKGVLGTKWFSVQSTGETYTNIECLYTGSDTYRDTPLPESVEVWDHDANDQVDPALYDVTCLDADLDEVSAPDGPGKFWYVVEGIGGNDLTTGVGFEIMYWNDLRKASVGNLESMLVYTGAPQSPSYSNLTLWTGTGDEILNLDRDVDYSVSYEDADGATLPGAPTDIGSYNIVFTATDSGACYGRASYPFEIVAANSLKLADVGLYATTLYTTGESAEFDAPVSIDGKVLTKGVDYVLRFEDANTGEPCSELLAGEGAYYVVYVEPAKDSSYTDSTSVNVYVESVEPNPDAKSLADTSKVECIATQTTYDGGCHSTYFTLLYDGVGLDLYTDYDLVYGTDCTSVGDHYVIVQGIGNYKDTLRVDLKVLPRQISAMTMTSPTGTVSKEYTGEPITFEGVAITDPNTGQALVEGTDFVVGYVNNVNPGTARLVAAGIGNYGGALTYGFGIEGVPEASVDISDEDVIGIARSERVPYTGNAYADDASFVSLYLIDTFDDLVVGTDYDITFTDANGQPSDVKEVGTYSVHIQGKGAYRGEIDYDVTVYDPHDLSQLDCSMDKWSINLDTDPNAPPQPQFWASDPTYSVSYLDPSGAPVQAPFTQTGIYTLVATGTGSYAGSSIELPFQCVRNGSIVRASVLGVQDSYTHTGDVIAIDPVVRPSADADPLPEGSYTVDIYKRADYEYLVGGTKSEPRDIGEYTYVVTANDTDLGVYVGQFSIVDGNDFASAKLVVNDGKPYKYTGDVIVPECEVTLGGEELVEGDDYIIEPRYEYANAAYTAGVREAGEYVVYAHPIGRFAGDASIRTSVTVEYDIDTQFLGEWQHYLYVDRDNALRNGEPFVCSADVRDQNTDVSIGSEHYTLAYYDEYWNRIDAPVEAGTYHLVAAGAGGWAGTLEHTITIVDPRDLDNGNWIGFEHEVPYNGEPQRPTFTGYNMLGADGETVTPIYEDVDYTVSFCDANLKPLDGAPVDVGRYWIVLKAIEGSGWVGDTSLWFDITLSNHIGCSTVETQSPYLFTGSPVDLDLAVSIGDTELAEGTDYAVTYSSDAAGANAIDAPSAPGTYYAQIQATGDTYTGSTVAEFTIAEPTIIEVPVAKTGLVYTGMAQTGVEPSSTYSILGTIQHADAGDYTTRVVPKPGYAWAGLSVEMKELSWSIARQPLLYGAGTSASYMANGSEQSPLAEEPLAAYIAAGKVTVEGAPAASVEVGDYSATLTPSSNYCWEDGSYEPLQLQWTIVPQFDLDAAVAAAEALLEATPVRTNDEAPVVGEWVTSEQAQALRTATDAAKALKTQPDATIADKYEATVALNAAAQTFEAASVNNGVEHFEGLAEALPAAEDVKITDAGAIEEVKGVYDALTERQKAQVDAAAKAKLDAADAALADVLADEAAAQAVEELINALPAPDDVTLDDAETIETAAAAYGALAAEQKSLVSEAATQKLADDVAALDQRRADVAAAQTVTDAINALPDAAAVTASDKDAIEAASAAYANLTDAQKALVPQTAKDKLAADEAALAQALADAAAAQAVADKIEALPEPSAVMNDPDPADLEAIRAVQTEFDALTDAQKALIPQNLKGKLMVDYGAVKAHDEAQARGAMALYNALPDPASVTAENAAAAKTQAQQAQAAYDALSEYSKLYFEENLLGKPAAVIAAADAALEAAANQAAADAVTAQINALPAVADVELSDKAAVDAARAALNGLTNAQKSLVPQAAKDKLAAAEARIAELEDEAATPTIARIWGDYANETSAKISAEAFDKSDWVVIARDDDFADALGATGLAGALDAPIILTDRFELSPAAKAEVQRLGAKHAYIIGGTGAIKTAVDDGLKSIGVTVEPRVWGDASYDTSLACAQTIEKVVGERSPIAIIAMSTNFQDALSMSTYAYKFKVPVILQTWGATSAERGFTDEAAAWLSGRGVLVAGGAGAISNASIAPYTLVERLWGDTGYDTSQAIAEYMVSNGYLDPKAVVFACGAQAPKGTDALAGAALGGKLGAPMLLVNTQTNMEGADTTTVDKFYAANASKVKTTYVLGGAYVMPPALFAQIQSLNNALDVSE